MWHEAFLHHVVSINAALISPLTKVTDAVTYLVAYIGLPSKEGNNELD